MSRLTRILLIVLSVSAGTAVFAQTSGKTVRWPAVPGAGGYVAEIKDTGSGRVTRSELREPAYTINVPDGDYEFRVGALNRFGKNPVFSRWVPLKVRIARVPQISGEPVILSGESSSGDLTVRGSGFSSDIKAYLEKDGKRTELEISGDVNENTVTFEAPDVADGTYNLVLVNPLNKTATAKGFVKIIGADPVDRWQVLWRSAVLPGWGQYYANNKIQAYVAGGSMLAALGFFIYADFNYLSKEETFTGLTGDVNDATYRASLISARNELQSAASLQNTAFFIVLGTYALNLIDAAFFNGPYLSGSDDGRSSTALYFDGNNAFVTVKIRF